MLSREAAEVRLECLEAQQGLPRRPETLARQDRSSQGGLRIMGTAVSEPVRREAESGAKRDPAQGHAGCLVRARTILATVDHVSRSATSPTARPTPKTIVTTPTADAIAMGIFPANRASVHVIGKPRTRTDVATERSTCRRPAYHVDTK